MTTTDRWQIAIAIIGTVVNVGLLVGLMTQLWQFQRSTSADHARSRREATVTYLLATANHARNLRREGLPELIAADVAPFADDPLNMSDQRNHLIRHFLNDFEHLGTGLHVGVYDQEVIYELRSATIVRAWGCYAPWIQARRAFLKQPELYEHLERMAAQMNQMQKERGKEVIEVI